MQASYEVYGIHDNGEDTWILTTSSLSNALDAVARRVYTMENDPNNAYYMVSVWVCLTIGGEQLDYYQLMTISVNDLWR